MAESSIALRALQAVGLTAIGITTGYLLAFSTAVIPRILESPTPLMLKQWRQSLYAGAAAVFPAIFLCSGTFLYLAYAARGRSASRYVVYGYLTSAISTLAIVPVTNVFIIPLNKKLLAREEETRSLTVKDDFVEDGLGQETAHVLVDKWGTLNLGRAVLLIISTVSAVCAALMHDT